MQLLGLAFAAGFLFSFNPVTFASIPVALAYVGKGKERRERLRHSGAFILGLLVTHAVLGAIAGFGGDWMQNIMGHEWGILLGPVLLILGLMWIGWLKLRLPALSFTARPTAGIWGAFLLGIPFSVSVCPFCTPALLVALTTSAAIGSIPFGLALLLLFALGRCIPMMIGAWSIDRLQMLRIFQSWQNVIEKSAGFTLLIVGVYLIRDYFIGHG